MKKERRQKRLYFSVLLLVGQVFQAIPEQHFWNVYSSVGVNFKSGSKQAAWMNICSMIRMASLNRHNFKFKVHFICANHCLDSFLNIANFYWKTTKLCKIWKTQEILIFKSELKTIKHFILFLRLLLLFHLVVIFWLRREL